jgi:LCP family protein required for cell wall assembly
MKRKDRDDAAPSAQAPDYTLDFLEAEPGGNSAKPPKKKMKAGKGWTTKRIVLLSIVGVLVLALAGAGIWYLTLRSNPMGQFETVASQITPPPNAPQASAQPGVAAEPGATGTPSPLDLLMAQADTSFLKDTINILLIGVDHSVDRDTEEWVKHGGKQAFHSDVMLVLAVNKTTGAVNMISLPRDTYVQIPGVDGIYKLNASIDCGGGWPTSKDGSRGGFEKVCEAASWMLGGIPVNYYYAVDMNAVKGLAEAIGGVQNFDVEEDFKIAGRSYKKGVQDMNGQAVLDYLRVRKNIEDTGDLNRINRQKKMLIAIFDKIKKNGLLTTIPGLIDAFDGNLYTNVPLSYTAGLALFAMDVDPGSIGMYSMGGRYYNGIFNWNFVITDQKARVALIKQIYGVDVEEYSDYAAPAATRRWEKMRAPVIKNQGAKALAKVKAKLDADAALPIYTEPTPTPPPAESKPPEPTPSSTPEPSPTPTPTESDAATESAGMMALSVSTGSGAHVSLSSPPAGYRKYLADGPVWALYNKAVRECSNLSTSGSTAAMKAANSQAIADVTSICATFGITISKDYWRVNYERNSNEIWVDFN